MITNLTIFETEDLIAAFEIQFGWQLGPTDHLEIFNQLFQILDRHAPIDLIDRKVLTYESLVFANHLTFDPAVVDQIARRLLSGLWGRLIEHEFYIDGVLMYFPYSMHGYDLCVRRYHS